MGARGDGVKSYRCKYSSYLDQWEVPAAAGQWSPEHPSVLCPAGNRFYSWIMPSPSVSEPGTLDLNKRYD